MFSVKLVFLILFSSIIYGSSLSIDEKTQFYDLLPSSQIYIDKTKSLTIKDIQIKDKEFKKNDKQLLGFGYAPDFNVWIKFTLKNQTNKRIEKIIEYDNSLTTNIKFFNPNNNYVPQQDGLFTINQKRKTINPTFKIILQPHDIKTYYLKVHSDITTLIVKLNIWETDKFYTKEIKHQLVLALFFGAMFILAIYNLFIYFFTKDISYLYYVFYMFGIMIHHVMYVGLSYIYLLKADWINCVIQFAPLIVALPVFALGFFTKYFLQIKKYKMLNKILNIFLILILIFISTIIFIVTDEYDKYRNILTLCLFIYLIIITIYSAFKKNRQAYFILIGWFIIFIAMFFMLLSSSGIFNIYKYCPYFVEISLVLEAIIFSVALADRINGLQKEKNEVNNKLIAQQQNEKERFKIKVEEKTNDLKIALDEKGLLLKELNHRVKNNMQTIVSLVRLQADEIEDDKLQDMLITIQNRINAMSHLHELLYKQDDISHINSYEYFDLLIEEIKKSYDSDINIYFDIKIKLKMEKAIYCGLILNELITNSLKYAFPKKHGNINISLKKENQIYKLYISDNGIGYDQNNISNSLGLVLVNTLAKDQLAGKIKINSVDGVSVEINWNDYD